MNFILNLTSQPGTREQIDDGLFDVGIEQRAAFSHLLTFNDLPIEKDLENRAIDFLRFVNNALTSSSIKGRIDIAKQKGIQPMLMIGGPQFFMPILAEIIEDNVKYKCCYAFLKRVQQRRPDGVSVSNIVHGGFVRHYRY